MDNEEKKQRAEHALGISLIALIATSLWLLFPPIGAVLHILLAIFSIVYSAKTGLKENKLAMAGFIISILALMIPVVLFVFIIGYMFIGYH